MTERNRISKYGAMTGDCRLAASRVDSYWYRSNLIGETETPPGSTLPPDHPQLNKPPAQLQLTNILCYARTISSEGKQVQSDLN